MLEIINWTIAATSVPVIIFLVQLAISRARQLNARIEEYHAEQEVAKSQSSHVNPYADLAVLFNADPSSEQKD